MKLSELQQNLRRTPRPLFFGGSFNPFHWGHKTIVLMLHQYFPSCPITLLPKCISPLKPLEKGISLVQRIDLMQAVLQDLYRELPAKILCLELCELRSEGPSYTADTLRYLLCAEKSQARCVFVMGWDSFCQLGYWKDWPYLLETCILVVFGRKAGRCLSVLPEIAAQAEYLLLDLDEPYSSSDIRQLLVQRPEKWPKKLQVEMERLLGARQLGYIQEQGLYLGASQKSNLSLFWQRDRP